MFCDQCGNQVPNGLSVCPKCGKPLAPQASSLGGAAPEQSAGVNHGQQPAGGGQYNQSAADYVTSTGAQGFISKDEKPIYSLKNGVGWNMLSGEGWHSEDAVITNRRLYYSDKVGFISKTTIEQIVDLDDITGTAIMQKKPYGIIVLGSLISFSFFINCISNLNFLIPAFFILGTTMVVFSIAKKAYLNLEYAGGRIHFSVKKYGIQNVREFQRNLFMAKQMLNENNLCHK